MQFILNFTFKDKLCLPLSYHHCVQGLIYKIIQGNSQYSNELHDNGYSYNGYNYKLFTFGLLKGNYKIANKQIIFSNSISLEIRTPMPDFSLVFKNLLKEGMSLTFNNHPITLSSFNIVDYHVTSSKIKIKMNSPVTIHKALEDHKTYFYTPLDLDFSEEINNNFSKKLSAAIQNNCIDTVSIKVLQISSSDKYVTKFKNNVFITAWKGLYELSGPAHALDFLYNSGIGSNNSQGFGMFDIIN